MSLVRRTGGVYPSFIEDFFDNGWPGQSNLFDTGTKIPAVNVIETDEKYEIHVAAPGKDKADFDVNVENNILSISAESIHRGNDAHDNYAKQEFSFTSFKRTFSLPETVEQENIKANYDRGILKLTIPNKEEAHPKPRRRIEIQNS